MKLQNKIIEFYPSGEVKVLDDSEPFNERIFSLKKSGYTIKTTYLDSLGKRKFKDSIAWDPNKTSLHKIAKLEVSGLNKEICAKLVSYLRDAKINDIIPIDDDKIMTLTINSFDYQWEISEIKRSDITDITILNSSQGWRVNRKKSSYRNPHDYTKYTIHWDPKIISIEDIIPLYTKSISHSSIPAFEQESFRDAMIRFNRHLRISQLV